MTSYLQDSAVFSFPASFSQQRLWFLDQLTPGSAVYNIPAAFRIRGALNISAMEQSLAGIVNRHEALRTTFGTIDSQPMQFIRESLDWTLPLVDLTGLAEEQREAEVQRLVEEEAIRPFDLQKGPLLRTTLLRLSEQEHVLMITMHHIISDGWSAQVFIRELSALYSGAELPELPIQYADFAHYQREWMQGEVLEEQLDFWKKQLSGNLSVLQVPSDRPRPSEQSYTGGSYSFALPKGLTEQLKQLSQREGVTLFMTLMAAYKTLLYRYTAQEEILVGTPVAGRNLEEVEGLIGFFVNNVVLRSFIEGSQSFRDLLKNVRKAALDAYAHQEVPFEKLVEELQPERNMAYSPIFQTMFVLQGASVKSLPLADLTMELIETERTAAKFDILFDMVEEADGLAGIIEYSTDLFDLPTIERMAGHFRVLLEGIAANPAETISKLPILLEDEQQRLLVEWNDTHMEYPLDACTHQLFEAQAERTPDRTALIVGEERLTYRELNERANRMAHYLRTLGVGPEVLVGVCMERTEELLVGLLGVFKAGGAYVPLDPDYPKDRIEIMLEDSQAPVLLTQERLLESLPEHGARTVCIDRDWAEIAAFSSANPEPVSASDNLAYVIYTSGSTGRPKGVAITQQNAVNFIFWALKSFTEESLSSVLFSTSVCFDLSIYEMFVPLAMGGQVIVAKNALHLPTLPAREEVTLINTVPSAIAELVRMGGVPKSVRIVNLAGEPLQNSLVQAIYALGHIDEVVNLYGPTEDTTYATWATIPRDATGIPTIGKPVANNQIYLLDEHLNPVPQGVAGELYIGGHSLARCYLNQPEMTAERFIANPFESEPGARMYKTGDLARYRPDGNIEYLGRLDHQVKIRGFRIELGEIESVLSKHPSVDQVVVVARRSGLGDLRLVAYLGCSQQRPTVSELRGHLRGKLPAYMMPSIFVVLDALPLTPNGKIDRKQLPEPEQSQLEADTQFVAPRTPTEETLAGIFAELLERKQVGVEDNFFEIGGHSLLATQLVSRIRAEFGVELALRHLFESPTVESLAELVESTQGGGSALAPIERVSRDGELPLSFAQQRLWLIDQFSPNNAAYNIYAAVRMNGDLNRDALQDALNEIVARHEALRTTFVKANGSHVQRIAAELTLPLPVTDLSALPHEEREGEVKRLATLEATTPFDLGAGPLVRVTLLKLSEGEHVLLLNMHHIISDGWSIGVFVNELATLYSGRVTGSAVQLPELPIQYADFAGWQNEWLQGGEMDRLLGYWTQQLGGELPVLELPTDRPRPPVQTFNGAKHKLAFAKDFTDNLKALSQREGVTLFMTLLAGFYTLLHRYSGQEDLIVGSPIANRTRPETEGLIGFFVNTLAMRVSLDGAPSFRDLLQRVRETALDAYEHQDMPFEKLVEALQPERDMSRTPLFQAMFNLQNAPMPALELPGLNLALMEVESDEAKFDLTFQLTETEDGLQGWIEYNTDLYDAATMERMAEHYRRLLESGCAQPEQGISLLPILPEAEAHTLLVEWNDTTTNYPRDMVIHQLFEEQVERTPDSIAVTFRGSALTYRELNERANRLAHYLRRQGVGPDALVGVCVERSLEMIVAVVGILKAGCAYVPIDPNYPAERFLHLLEDSRVGLLLTLQHFIDKLPANEATVFALDSDWEQISGESAENLPIDVTATSLAYVNYTSGSTGKPKGVSIPHRAVVRLVKDTNFMTLTENEVFLQFASISFDAATLEIWGPLLNGGRLAVFPPHTPSLAELGQVLREEGINALWLTAGLFHQMVDRHPEDLRGIRQLLAGGDALSVAHVKKVIEQLPETQLINGYGPTENTTFTCCYPAQDPNKIITSVPIGRPISNTRVYVLDRNSQPVPIGVPGELYIGGDGLACEYLNQPELTARTFVPNPFAAGERLYKTGDWVRWLPDGTVEFLGRIDNQVKIRGFRIELGEIEAAVGDHPAVKDKTVLVREDSPGDKRIVAYVVPHASATLEPSALRSFLKEKMPDHMVPNLFVVLDEIPLTPNGKVDRRALPLPELTGLEDAYVAPRTPLEEMVASIWTDVLHVDKIGVHDNFFDLGGHSLLATQLLAKVGTTFGLELPLRILFEAPTVAELAERIGDERNAGPQIPAMVRVSRDGDLPLSFVQQRMWFLDQLQPGNAAYNIYSAVRLTGELNVAALEASLTEIVKRHEALRTTFAAIGSRQVQVIAPAHAVTLPILDLSHLPEAEREGEAQRLATEEALKPFDLAAGPLMRVALLRLSETEHVMLLTMHHIISDGWSVSVFVSELGELYAGRAADLPELPVQYADYASWQGQWLSGDVMDNMLGYWKKQLGGELPVLEFPTDRPRPQVPTYKGSKQLLVLSSEQTAQLKDLCQREGVTLFMTLLAGFTTVLQRYSGQDDIIVGSPIANRTRAETQGLIGCFVNALAMRVNLEGNPSFRDLLQRVREVSLDAYAHQDMPFEKLVEELQPERSLNRNPIFDVMLNLVNTPQSTIELPGLTLSHMDMEDPESKFTMTLYAEEKGSELHLRLVYQSDLFTEARMATFLDQFQFLLTQAAAEPDRAIRTYSLVTPNSAALLPNPSLPIEEPRYTLVPEQFIEIASALPHQAAITKSGQTWTYAELLTSARRIAGQLAGQGIAKGDAVAVCGERNFALYAGMIGVLMSGGVLITLDRNLPAQRQQLMLETAQAKGLLYVGERREDDAWMTDANTLTVLIDLDPATAQASAYLPEGELPCLEGDDAAYIFFTSGTTGVPKGVLGRHRGLAHFVTWQREEFAIGMEDRMSQLTGLSFDVVLRDIFTTLTSGATLCLPEDGDDLVPEKVMNWLDREGITLMHTVPARTQSWLAAQIPGVSLRSLRAVFFAGEPLTDTLVRKWRDAYPEAGEVVNLYGPTETTLAKCFYRVPQADLSAVQPVGSPLPQTQVLVLNDQGQLCGIGEPGEIVIRTPFRSLGYINVEAGQSRFVPNPFRDDARDELYHTGDLGAYRPDGLLEILGRADDQVKIRGMRVELGEILAVLQQHPAVREGVVIVKADDLGEKRLVAYVVYAADGEVPTTELRSYLKERLPAHMIPTAFVTLEQLPLTANGKVDRKKLPEPTNLYADFAEAYVAPSNELEGDIAAAWCEVLRLPQVGVNDNFFDLGGHSLLLVQLQTQLKERLNRDIQMVDLFKYPTVASLAKHLSQGQEQMNLEENFDRAASRRDALKAQRNKRQGNRRN